MREQKDEKREGTKRRREDRKRQYRDRLVRRNCHQQIGEFEKWLCLNFKRKKNDFIQKFFFFHESPARDSKNHFDGSLLFLVACYTTLNPAMSVRRSVRRLVGRLVPFLLFWRFWAFLAYGSCPDALVTFSSTAPAHPHATWVAVYPALFISIVKTRTL